MPRPRKVPAVLIEATIRENSKLAALPNDTARLGYVYICLGAAKLVKPIPGLFTSRSHFREIAGRFAVYLKHYLATGLVEEAPKLCDRCAAKWSTTPPGKGALVTHDWHEHQYDPFHAERQAAYEAREAAKKAGQEVPVSDAISDGETDAETDVQTDAETDVQTDEFLTPDSRAHARSGPRDRAPNSERRTQNGESPNESLQEEDRSPSLARRAEPERPDVQALLDRGWRRVTQGQRRVLDEVLGRHDVTGPAWAAAIIGSTPPDADPLESVKTADSAWQLQQREAADRVDAGRNGHDRTPTDELDRLRAERDRQMAETPPEVVAAELERYFADHPLVARPPVSSNR